MGKIDRYLLRQFLWIFVIFFSSFLGLFVVADGVNNFEEFSTYGKDHGGFLKVVGEYYGYRAFAFFDQISPLLILIAAMFTIAAFRRHNEMTALLAAGISKARIVRPIIAAAIVFAMLAVANRELMIPTIREKLNFKAQDLLSKARPVEPVYDNQTDISISCRGILRRTQTLIEPNFSMPLQLNDYGRQVQARRAVYRPPTADRPGGYHLQEVQYPQELATKPSLKVGDRAILITPLDADWLDKRDCFIVSGVDFQLLVDGQSWRRFSSTPELIAALGNPSLQHGAGVQVKVHARIVKPLLDVTLLFLGLPLVLSRRPHNLFVSVGFCVLLVLVYTVVLLGCHHLGSNLVLQPALAAWAPLMIFVPLAVVMAEPLRE
jgi:lipopolysaccharide export system permease protein